MRNLSNKTLFTIFLIFLIGTGVFSYLTYMNFTKIMSIESVYKLKNKELKSQINSQSENLNGIISKIEATKSNLENISKIEQRYIGITNFDLNAVDNEIKKYSLTTFKNNYNLSVNSDILNKDEKYRKLIVTFFQDDEVRDLNSAKNNFLTGSLILNDFINSKLQPKIFENNNRLNKMKGVFNFFNNTNNFLLKYKINNYLTEKREKDENYLFPKSINGLRSEIINLEDNLLKAFDVSLIPSKENSAYLSEIKSIIDSERANVEILPTKDKTFELYNKNLKNIMVLSTDLYSQNVDFLKNYKILDKTYDTNNGVEVLRYLIDDRNRIYMAEVRVDGKAKYIYYYDSSAIPFFALDIDGFKLNYLDKKSNLYNDALRVLNKFN